MVMASRASRSLEVPEPEAADHIGAAGPGTSTRCPGRPRDSPVDPLSAAGGDERPGGQDTRQVLPVCPVGLVVGRGFGAVGGARRSVGSRSATGHSHLHRRGPYGCGAHVHQRDTGASLGHHHPDDGPVLGPSVELLV